jgi:Cu(I)/Ag(I) efflux system protein CusF
MIPFTNILAASAIAGAVLLGTPAFAQSMPMSPQAGAPSAPSMTEGEVRKVDLEAGKLTIRHGEIKHLEMPGMTMVFTAKDKTMLEKLKVGDAIKFMVVNEGGKFVVTEIQPAR